MRKFCTSDLSFALSRRSACAIASSCPLPRRTPSPPRSAARLSVPAASLRPLLLLGRRHGHHHRQCRPHHRHHRCRCHHHHNLWWRGACITCTLSRHSSCLVATTTSSFSSTGAARCAPPPRLSSPSLLPLPRSSRSSRCLLLCWHAHAPCCVSYMPSAHCPHRLWTAAVHALAQRLCAVATTQHMAAYDSLLLT